jgi:hypothetical protein
MSFWPYSVMTVGELRATFPASLLDFPSELLRSNGAT